MVKFMEKVKPKISVIVPVYNVEDYLEKCLESLVNQSLQDIEIILVDDGSTDSSSDIIKKYAEKYSNIHAYHKKNGGLSDARNYGLRYAIGEYIAFLDSDDYVELNMYELLYKKAKLEDSDIVECNLYHDFLDEITPEYGRKIYDKGEMIRIGRSVVWNKIYKRTWLKETDVIFPRGLIYEDVEFYCKIVPWTQKVSYIDDVLIHYVQRSSSINNKSTIKTKQILNILENIIEYYKINNLYTKYYESIEYLCARIVLCSSFSRMLHIEDRKQRMNALNANYTFLTTKFPKWKKNKYIKEQHDLKGMYMRCMNNSFLYWGIAGLWTLKIKFFEKNRKY